MVPRRDDVFAFGAAIRPCRLRSPNSWLGRGRGPRSSPRRRRSPTVSCPLWQERRVHGVADVPRRVPQLDAAAVAALRVEPQRPVVAGAAKPARRLRCRGRNSKTPGRRFSDSMTSPGTLSRQRVASRRQTCAPLTSAVAAGSATSPQKKSLMKGIACFCASLSSLGTSACSYATGRGRGVKFFLWISSERARSGARFGPLFLWRLDKRRTPSLHVRGTRWGARSLVVADLRPSSFGVASGGASRLSRAKRVLY